MYLFTYPTVQSDGIRTSEYMHSDQFENPIHPFLQSAFESLDPSIYISQTNFPTDDHSPLTVTLFIHAQTKLNGNRVFL